MGAPWLLEQQRLSFDLLWEMIAQLRHYQGPWAQHDQGAQSPFREVYGVGGRHEEEKG